jgi:hypothetical protein
LAAPGRKIPGSQFVELRQEGQQRPPWLRHHFVQLAQGDCIALQPGTPARLSGGRLHVAPAVGLPLDHGKELSLYRPYLALWFVTLPAGVDDADLFLAHLRQESRPRDIVFLRNGDRLEGTVTALAPELGCEVSEDQRKVSVAWDKLAGIAWKTRRPARPRRVEGHAVLKEGTRLNFTHLRYTRATHLWTGKTWFGETFAIAADRLVALDRWHGPAVYLSELAGRYEHTPYLGVRWPLVADAAVNDRPLTLVAGVFDKGLGMHSQSKVRYALDGKYRWFEAVVGLDETAGDLGRVRLAVSIDGKRQDLGGKKEWSLRDGALPIRINVRQARELSLLVDFGSRGDVRAHVDWGNARLLKEK